MTNQDIFALMDRFERSALQSMKVSTGEYQIEFQKGALAAPPADAVVSAPAAAAREPVPGAAAAREPQSPVITAPLVGTFYAAPGPDQAPFVQAGDRVDKGQTVCLLEAMKMMSEVPAPCDCVIEAVLKSSGELASFGEPLFRYKPC